jgi:anthraniloyl-CoA monooxygenase
MAGPLNVVCVGGGPAGLYFGALLKSAWRGSRVTVLERNPAGVTYGWGVVFWERLLDHLHWSDLASARAIAASAASWSGQEVRMCGGRTAYVGGSGYSIGRRRLLEILAGRAAALGVDLRFQREVTDLADLAGADLVVACDGAGSRIRQQRARHFGTNIDVGRNRYIWLGTTRVFDAFTFAFERTPAGWIWFHAYRFDDEGSTCIVECSPETWTGLGLDTLGAADSMRLLGNIFASYLHGHALTNRQRGTDDASWRTFRWVTNLAWRHGNVVLMGDAAHTTHFAIGLGTELAMLDAIALARHLRERRNLGDALIAYEDDRRAALVGPVARARSSADWFEEVDSYAGHDVVRFAYSLWSRRGRLPWWRSQVHVALQTRAGRASWRLLLSARRAIRRRRRGRGAAP